MSPPVAGFPGTPTDKVDAPDLMMSGGQASPLVVCAGADGSPAAWDFEPNSWPKRDPIDELVSETESRTLLPPPQPESSVAPMIHAAARQYRARPWLSECPLFFPVIVPAIRLPENRGGL